MKFATALTLFTASSAMKLKHEFNEYDSIEVVLDTKLSALSPIQHTCTKIELERAIREHELAPKAAQDLRDSFAKYVAGGRTIGAMVKDLLHPHAVEEGMTEQEEEEELDERIDSIWHCY